jgi:hypothetical protein
VRDSFGHGFGRLGPSVPAADLRLVIPFFAIDPSGEVIRSVEQSLAVVPGVRQVTLDWDAHPIGLTIEVGSTLPAPLRAVVHAHGWCAGLLERA